MTAPELLPCPFCGGEAHVAKTGGSDERFGYCATWVVHCMSCSVRVFATDTTDENGWSNAKEGETKSRAIAAWNRRALPARGVGVVPLDVLNAAWRDDLGEEGRAMYARILAALEEPK